jgi:hypothetical protein
MKVSSVQCTFSVGPQGVELVGINLNVLALTVLVARHDLVAVHLTVDGADLLIVDALVANGTVNQPEGPPMNCLGSA